MESRRLGNLYGFTGGNYAGNVYDKEALSPTLLNMQGGNRQPMIVEATDKNTVLVKQAVKQGYIEMESGGVCDLSYPNSTTRRGRVQEGGKVCPTLTTGNVGLCKIDVVDEEPKPNLRIRKLTPKECYRLMGFSDEAFDKAEQVNSNTQLYKQAGNSIVVDVLMAIFDNLLISSRSVWLDELLKEE